MYNTVIERIRKQMARTFYYPNRTSKSQLKLIAMVLSLAKKEKSRNDI